VATPVPGDPEYVAEDPRLAQLIGQPGPAIALPMVDGQKIDLKPFYGKKPVYLKLWATYCIPCRAQMPGFETIYERFGDRMEVIAVNAGVGDDAAKVKAFARKAGMHMPLAIDDGALGAWIKLQATPLHIIIGRDGRVLYAAHQDGPQLDAAIKTAIAAKGGGPVTTTAVASIAVLKPGDSVPAIALRNSQNQPVDLKRGATSRPRASPNGRAAPTCRASTRTPMTPLSPPPRRLRRPLGCESEPASAWCHSTIRSCSRSRSRHSTASRAGG